ncbi:MAG: L-threonylcarbamoyladenylate synthase [Beijerinckiaceae bacterium]
MKCDDPASSPNVRYTTLKRPAGPEYVLEAAQILLQGGLVAFPTETVYGLGADATSNTAVAKIYAAKRRPIFNPLIAHVVDLAAAQEQGVFKADALALAQTFWPGPLTLVVPLTQNATVCDLARAGLDSVALRVPAHPVALNLLAAVGRPLAAPSANLSGHVSPVTADHVLADLDGALDLVLDAGPCPVGLESTIIACLDGGPRLLRPGGVPRGAIETLLQRKLAGSRGGVIRAPGSLTSHYAPRARLRLAATSLRPGECGLDFGGVFPRSARVLDLSPQRDLTEAAANLFHHLRTLDSLAADVIAVAPIEEAGLGEAINDRLRRAAAERPS